MSDFNKLRLKQVDDALEAFAGASRTQVPRRGWIRAIRNALGMSARQLGDRIGVSQSTVANLERSEQEGTITLASLRRLGEGLGCRFVYGFVPLAESLEAMLRERAERSARAMVETASVSMALEHQAIPELERERQIEELTRDLLSGHSRRLWDDARL